MRIFQTPAQDYNDLATRLTEWVTTFEDILHIISGPFLAAGALIATSFVFTDGAIGRAGGIGTTLIICWSITQAVGLDFQVLSLGYRSINAARAGRWGVFASIVSLALVLGFVGVQTHAVFGYVSSNGSSIPNALSAMGIDQRILLWERAGLSFLLTFIAGAMRPAKRPVEQARATPVSETTIQSIQSIQEQLQVLDRKITALPEPALTAVPALSESTVQEMIGRLDSLTTTVTQIKQSSTWNSGHWASPIDGAMQPTNTQPLMLDQNIDEMNVFKQQFTGTGPLVSGAQGSREQEIRELLVQEPGLSGSAIAKRVGCSVSTANAWKKRIETETEKQPG